MSWKTPVTLLVLLGVLFAAAYYGWSTVISATPDQHKATTTPAPSCATKKVVTGRRLKARNVVVNVYNSGTVEGLAGRTLNSLKARGFKGGLATNAPAGLSTRTVMIVASVKTGPQIRLVALQFIGHVPVTVSHSLTPGVNVVVGDSFPGFRAAVRHGVPIKKPVKTCSSVSTTGAS